MAYMNQEKKRVIAINLKKILPKGWKVSLGVRNHSTICCTIKSAPVNLLANFEERQIRENHVTVNHYYLENSFEGQTLETMKQINEALNTDNFNHSDIQTDYFHVGHYVDLQIGAWNKPFEVK